MLAPELTAEFNAYGLAEYVSDEYMDEDDARMAVYQALHELWLVQGCPDYLDPGALLTEAGIIEGER